MTAPDVKPAALLLVLLASCRASAPEAARYHRIGPRGPVPECAFERIPDGDAWTLRSVTGALVVEARYGPGDVLLEARAGAARVAVEDGRARISRPGLEPQLLEVPPGVIVTSAPDWSDAFRIARLWKADGPARQEFPGLWIHPVQPALRLVFTAERAGEEVVDGLRLQRLTIRLRGNSPYAAWVDPAGRLLKLASLPFGPSSAVLVLEGAEAAASALRPP